MEGIKIKKFHRSGTKVKVSKKMDNIFKLRITTNTKIKLSYFNIPVIFMFFFFALYEENALIGINIYNRISSYPMRETDIIDQKLGKKIKFNYVKIIG